MKNMKIVLVFCFVIISLVTFVLLFKNQETDRGGESIAASDDESASVSKNEQEQKENGDELTIEILLEGTGEEVEAGENISVHYIGTFEDGTGFDSSVDRGVPFSFKLGAGQVIEGWDLGVLGMKVGEKRRLTIPSSLGYGEKGVPGAIPPNATLIFIVELLSVSK